MRTRNVVRPACVAVALGVAGAAGAGDVVQGVDGPVLYKQVSDGPFSCVNFVVFELEDFEDHLLNAPGLSVTGGFITSSLFSASRDSIDIDDGDLNNLSTNNAGTYQGDSWYVQGSVSFTFDPAVLGGLPTHAGLVITDATFGAATITGYDVDNQPVGSLVYEFPDPGDGSCDDDDFYGAFSQVGISRLEVLLVGDTEIDHVQYGFSDLAAESDLNDDGSVNGADLGILLSNWDTPCLGDLNGDFTVDGADLGVLLSNWG